MRFYTWKDIERYILMHHDEWKDELYDIEVYPNEMVVYPKSEQGTLQNAVLKKLFPKNIAPDNLSIKLDGQGVPKCSNAKISDIKAEYENLKPIFEKLEDLPTDEKTLPMNLENNIFTSVEEKSMTQSGYLKRDGEKLYLPEIIRHALGFRYEKGARPRVLSLLLKH